MQTQIQRSFVQDGDFTATLALRPPIQRGPKRVFIVDDSADVRDLFQLLAEQNGFLLESAKNGEEALVKLAELKEDPTIVFVDLNMPIMNGADFLLRLKERGLAASSRIVIFSAYEKQAVHKLDKSLTWLSKPFKCADVLNTINLARIH